MNLDVFADRISPSTRTKLSGATLAIWHCIHSYISEHGQSDRFEGDLHKRVRDTADKWVSEATLQRHLKRMTDAGLLQGHRVLVKYTPLGKIMGDWGSLLRGDGPPAGVFIRYTLPGMTPILKPKDEDSDDERIA